MVNACRGLFPDGSPCPWRGHCLRFTAGAPGGFIQPKIEGQYCFDRETQLARDMIKIKNSALDTHSDDPEDW